MADPFRLYFSHSWSYGDACNRLVTLLSAVDDFDFVGYAVPFDDPVHGDPNTTGLSRVIAEFMAPCDAVLVMAGLFNRYGRWKNLEAESARGNLFSRKPVILVNPWADQEVGDADRSIAHAVVGWNGRAIADTIRRLLGEGGK